MLVQFEGRHGSGSTSSEVNGETKTPQKNGKLQQEADLQSSPMCQTEDVEGDDEEVKNIEAKSSQGEKDTLCS